MIRTFIPADPDQKDTLEDVQSIAQLSETEGNEQKSHLRANQTEATRPSIAIRMWGGPRLLLIVHPSRARLC